MRTLLIIIPVAILAVFVVLNYQNTKPEPEISVSPSVTVTPTKVVKPQSPTLTVKKIVPTPTPLPRYIYIDGLSFSAQAPFGDWQDPVQQDGCEEASVITAVYWAQNKTFTKSEALEMIKNLSQYQIQKYGQARDTSAEDTWNRLVVGYFSHSKSEVRQVTGIKDIVNWLSQNKLVIIPANGQELNNPNFTSPGPDRHMVVVRGYDEKTREFITNDVGTRQGENYRYPELILFKAIRDYPTGDHLPIEEIKKNAILVWK